MILSGHLVCQRGVDVDLVEPPGDHGQQQHHRGQQTREPEGGVRHRHRQRAHRAHLEVELETKVREYCTITEKAPTTFSLVS